MVLMELQDYQVSFCLYENRYIMSTDSFSAMELIAKFITLS